MDELESSISVKISKEAVMSINSPENLFTSVNGKLETKVYIAGLPNRTDNVMKPVSWASHSREITITDRAKWMCLTHKIQTVLCSSLRSIPDSTAASVAGT